MDPQLKAVADEIIARIKFATKAEAEAFLIGFANGMMCQEELAETGTVVLEPETTALH